MIQFKEMSIFKGSMQVLYDITEIHYGYESHISRTRIAFESDIDGTGVVYDIEDIEEFEMELVENEE